MGLTLEESITEERDDKIPDVSLGKYRHARRILLSGRAVTNGEVAEETRGSKGTVTQIVKEMRILGFNFHERSEPFVSNGHPVIVKRFQLTNPSHHPTQAQYDALRAYRNEVQARVVIKKQAAKQPSTEAVVVPAEPEPEQHHLPDTGELPPLPSIGQHLRVYALVENPDGSMSVGLHNGSRQWFTTVIATSER